MTHTLVLLCCLFAGWALDRMLGEPRRAHPLVGFGRWVKAIERRCYQSRRHRGIMAVVLALLPVFPMLLVDRWLQGSIVWYGWAVMIAYVTIAQRSLVEHAQAVAQPLVEGRVDSARERLRWMVSRDVEALDAGQISAATVESVLENGSDAVVAAWFWFLLLGPVGAVLYRLSNTLDAMWGYRNDRYLHFGWAAARLDDGLNYGPARITALAYCLAGRFAPGWVCWHEQGGHWKSPNAGPVMAAGAGSLGLALGGPACYHGQWQHRPQLGAGRPAQVSDIQAALNLLQTALWWSIPMILSVAIIWHSI